MNNYSVYMHTSPSGKRYIGLTSRSIRKRANSNGGGYRGCPSFYNAIQKYGWDNIAHEIIFTGLTKEEAEAKEIELIALHGTNTPASGYNLDNGGNAIGTHSEATRAKMSASLKGKPIGRSVSEVTRQKHRKYMIEHNPQRGKAITEEQKAAMREARKRYTGAKHPKARAVRCTTTGDTYPTVKAAGQAVGVSPINITKSIQGKNGRIHAGSKDGIQLSWEYIDRGGLTMAGKKSFKQQINPAMQFITPQEEPDKDTDTPVKTTDAPEGYKVNPLYVEIKSRRLQLLVQPSLYEKIKGKAAAQGQSVNELIHTILDAWVKENQ